MIKSFWYQSRNVGDTLTPILLKKFTEHRVEYVERTFRGKVLAVGSIMKALRSGDQVWGAGVMRSTDIFPNADRCTFLAVRGKLSEKILKQNIGIYGDPAILLPLIYNQTDIQKKHKLGIVPHYVDFCLINKTKFHVINVFTHWKLFINQILQCEKIISSSLHGCIIAEAYGVPVLWEKFSDNVLGGGFKFKDYLSATDRTSFTERLTGQDIRIIQNNLIDAAKKIKPYDA